MHKLLTRFSRNDSCSVMSQAMHSAPSSPIMFPSSARRVIRWLPWNRARKTLDALPAALMVCSQVKFSRKSELNNTPLPGSGNKRATHIFWREPWLNPQIWVLRWLHRTNFEKIVTSFTCKVYGTNCWCRHLHWIQIKIMSFLWVL